MSKSRWFWFVILGAGLLGRAWFLLTRSAITQANADRIQPGMTRAEVEAILGPPGYHTNRMVIIKRSVTAGNSPGWVGYGGIVWIDFDEDTKCVLRVEFEPLDPPKTLLDRLSCLYPRWLPW